jgi:predicted ATPase
MKIQSIQLDYFKKYLHSPLFDFSDATTGLARDFVVIVGMNGSGKTSLLQAIATSLGVAVGRLRSLSDLEWPGYNYELLGSNWGRFQPNVKLKVQFSLSERRAVSNFYQKLKQMGMNLETPPAQQDIVTLSWHGDKIQAETASQLFQFKGREYAKQLLRYDGFQVFEDVGTILWYTEQRTSTSLTPEDREKKLEITDDILRDRLSKWRQFHLDVHSKKHIKELRPGQKDLYAEIERVYQAVFSEHSFEGSVPREKIDDILNEPWFYMYDGKNHYEISEMSGGERAIFPMLVDFASWNINNSVILIDEIELHLHPPLQQALLRALPKLGKNNQFIVTTHSDHVERLVPDAHIIRMEV